MRDVALPYRASVREERMVNPMRGTILVLCTTTAVLGLLVAFLIVKDNQRVEESKEVHSRLAASEACLANLHIVMERLTNPGPEQGVVVATVTCKEE